MKTGFTYKKRDQEVDDWIQIVGIYPFSIASNEK
jgi:hypothetical protein